MSSLFNVLAALALHLLLPLLGYIPESTPYVSSSTSLLTSFSIPDSPIPASITSLESPLFSSLAPSLFHSRLKTYTYFVNPSAFSFLPRTASTDYNPDRFF